MSALITRSTVDRPSGEARERLLAALAEVGVERDDYALIQQAKTLVDQVNARLRARGSSMVYSVTFCAASPPRTPDHARWQREQRPARAATPSLHAGGHRPVHGESTAPPAGLGLAQAG